MKGNSYSHRQINANTHVRFSCVSKSAFRHANNSCICNAHHMIACAAAAAAGALRKYMLTISAHHKRARCVVCVYLKPFPAHARALRHAMHERVRLPPDLPDARRNQQHQHDDSITCLSDSVRAGRHSKFSAAIHTNAHFTNTDTSASDTEQHKRALQHSSRKNPTATQKREQQHALRR